MIKFITYIMIIFPFFAQAGEEGTIIKNLHLAHFGEEGTIIRASLPPGEEGTVLFAAITDDHGIEQQVVTMTLANCTNHVLCSEILSGGGNDPQFVGSKGLPDGDELVYFSFNEGSRVLVIEAKESVLSQEFPSLLLEIEKSFDLHSSIEI